MNTKSASGLVPVFGGLMLMVLLAAAIYFALVNRQPPQDQVALVRAVVDPNQQGVLTATKLGGTSNVQFQAQGGAIPLQTRPFAVARTAEYFQWTAEDGRDTNVIRRLAHNDLEYGRMVEENT